MQSPWQAAARVDGRLGLRRYPLEELVVSAGQRLERVGFADHMNRCASGAVSWVRSRSGAIVMPTRRSNKCDGSRPAASISGAEAALCPFVGSGDLCPCRYRYELPANRCSHPLRDLRKRVKVRLHNTQEESPARLSFLCWPACRDAILGDLCSN